MQTVSITKIKPNPSNPRVIKDEVFENLCKSLTEFPEMLEKRPLVCFTDVDGKYVVLGGNQRLKAAQHVKLKQLPIVLCDDWTAEQKEMFLYRDNISAGAWDWETVSEWGKEELKAWGEDKGFDVDADELGEDFTLPDGDKAPFQQMTFTLADEQAEQIKNAIADIKQTEEYKYAETMGNENSNGNALYLIVMQWAEQRK